jgi:uncharacterized protein YmfQ (DUF2313 family)
VRSRSHDDLLKKMRPPIIAAAEWDNRPAAVHVAFASDDDVYKEDNCSFSWNFLN